MEFIERFLDWCNKNYISIQHKEGFIYHVDGLAGEVYDEVTDNVGDVILLEPDEYGKRFDDELGLNDAYDQLELLDSGVVQFAVFEFGMRFYIIDRNPKNLFRNKFNEVKYKAQFNDFKYLGNNNCSLNFPFVHLGVHSEYELLNGSHNSSLWVKKAVFLNHTSLAIADKDTLAGLLAFQTECEKKKIKSILGMTASVAINYDPSQSVQVTYDMKVYVQNEIGWQNILLINKAINVDYAGFIPEKEFLNLSEGLVAVFDTNSQLGTIKDNKAGKMLIKRYKSKFEHLFWQFDAVEFYDNEIDKAHLHKIKFYLDNYCDILPPVLINDSYYVDQEMYQLKEFLNKIDHKALPYSEDQHFKTLDEVNDKLSPLFKNKLDDYVMLLQEMITNTVVIDGLCNYRINTGEHKLPKYEFVVGESNEDFFIGLIVEGMERKVSMKSNYQEYSDRMERELGVIIGAGLIDYFLILWEIVHWAKQENIYVGVARGSVGGSLLAFLLDITEIDPIKHDLLFERFLNEARISGERAKSADSMPDVDVDFEAGERERVKQHIYEKFGKLHTCSIGSYTRLKLKAGIKDFGRARELGFTYCNNVTRDIDNQLEYTWKDLIEYAIRSEEVKNFIQKYPEIAHCIKFSLGQARSASIHASAVIIVPKKDFEGKDANIFNWVPIRKIEGVNVSEWEGKYCDKAGFLKEDILSLSQLDKFKRMIQLIERNHGLNIDLNSIPLDDENTYNLFSRGMNTDVFQFNSKGLKTYSKQVRPDKFEDLVAMNALYRPGPMGSNAHIDFALIKHGKKKPKYDYMLREVTESTLGLYVYQEQIMKAVVVLGNFSLVESDILRTQIKKFDKVAMRKSEEKFIKGAMDNGCNKDEAEKIWAKLVSFSAYGFNKSHSAAYAIIAYHSQWLKSNFPLEFWTSSLNFAQEGDDESIPNRICEIGKLRQGIKIKPPDINNSGIEFDCDHNTQTIYWSLMKIKGLGDASVRKILNERVKGGKFVDYNDFINRVPKKDINKKSVLTLILSGAFDEISDIEEPSKRIELVRNHYLRLNEKLPEEFTGSLIYKGYWWILMQRQLTGFGDIDYRSLLLKSSSPKLAEKYISPDLFVSSKRNRKEVVICGKVIYNKIKLSKNKKEYASINVQCNNEEISILIWQNCIDEEDNRKFIEECGGKIIAFSGQMSYDDVRLYNCVYSYDDTTMIYL